MIAILTNKVFQAACIAVFALATTFNVMAAEISPLPPPNPWDERGSR